MQDHLATKQVEQLVSLVWFGRPTRDPCLQPNRRTLFCLQPQITLIKSQENAAHAIVIHSNLLEMQE